MKIAAFASILLCSAFLAVSAASAQSLSSDAKPRVDTSGVNMQPAYPPLALQRKESGSVAVHAYVRDDGSVKKVSLEQSSGYDDLDNAAANAVLHWKFLPAMEGGKPVSGDTVVQIVFQSP